ncbi:winged helix-turn-helix domain-containing protein [Candidatus Woesearchaeota archaeon]|nr:winged helix-turn-helix domain-containing protein [Candidatus Woesearchaeota archaeon]
MGNIVVAPVGDNIDALFVGMREFPTEKVVLISTAKNMEKAEKAKKELERFKVPATIKMIEGDIWEGTFKLVADIKHIEKGKEIIINTSTAGHSDYGCAACSAAFVNGLKAISVKNDHTKMLPIFKFNYYSLISDKKKEILMFLFNEKDCCSSLQKMSEMTGMSLPLISYHINGNLKSQGLKEMGLVHTTEDKGKVSVKLTTLGRLLVQGYVE